jgi:hypothetical protein
MISARGTNPRAMPANSGRAMMILQVQNEQYVEHRDRHAPGERYAEQQVERDGGANDLRQIAGGDGDLTEHPEREAGGSREVIAAGLSEVATGDDAEFGGEALQQDRHEVRKQDDAEQRVPELRSSGEVSSPVAGVHVADRDEVSGSGKGEDFAEPVRMRDRDRPIDLGQARGDAGATPALFGRWRGDGRIRGWVALGRWRGCHAWAPSAKRKAQ